MPRRPGLKQGDRQIAFKIVAPRVKEALQSGRSVKSVYEEMKRSFPGSYSQFARYVRQSVSRTTVRETTDHAASRPLPPSSGDQHQNKEGPLELVLVPTARFKHDPRPASSDDLI